MIETKTIFLVLAVLSGLLFLGSIVFSFTAYKFTDGFGLPPPEEPERRKRRITGLVLTLISYLVLMGFFIAYMFKTEPRLMAFGGGNQAANVLRPTLPSTSKPWSAAFTPQPLEDFRKAIRRKMVSDILSRLNLPQQEYKQYVDIDGQLQDPSIDEIRSFIDKYILPNRPLGVYQSALEAITKVENATTHEELRSLNADQVTRDRSFW